MSITGNRPPVLHSEIWVREALKVYFDGRHDLDYIVGLVKLTHIHKRKGILASLIEETRKFGPLERYERLIKAVKKRRFIRSDKEPIAH